MPNDKQHILKARICIRVSTLRQAASGVSSSREDDDPGFQEQRCRELAAYNRWPVARVYTDGGVTGRRGGLAKRDQMARCIADTVANQDVIVFYDLSRLGRSAGFLINTMDQLADAGAHLASVTQKFDTTTAHGKFVFQLCAVLAELESNKNGERMRDVHATIKARLGYTTMGRQPTGFRLEGGLRVACEAERALVERVAALAAEVGYAGAAAVLEAQGTPTIAAMRGWNRDKRWDRKKVRAMVEKAKSQTAHEMANHPH